MTGRATDVDTVAGGGTKIQDNAYVWRSDGLLESRASHVGGNNAKLETFAYDPLGRLKTATTKLNNSATATRTLSQTYHANGNLKTKTSSVGADMDVSSYTSYGTRAAGPYAGPHAVTGARIDGKDHTFSYDADGNMIEYDCTSPTCGDDKYIEWNGRNLPHRITVGGSQADDTPTARDEFAYGPDGARYHRKTSYMDGETLRTENTYYAGSFEELLPRAGAAHTSIRQTRVTDGVRHVKTTAVSTADDGTKTTTTAKYVDYIHKDHLGSVEGVTGAAGARTRTLAYDPFGSRRKGDWTAALTPAEVSALAGSSDPRTRGHTGHEHLDRTGFIHRGGRVYDPALGRFLSPDPLVGNPGSAQAWNGYSYVSNSPMSFVDPSGLSQAPGAGGCDLVGVMCGAAGGGFGLASVVSTHRFSFVDIFVSVSSLITLDWGSGSGVIYNYSGESDPYFGGWGWGSFDAFAGVSYGYSYWSGSVQVTGQVGVVGTPNIPGRDMKKELEEELGRLTARGILDPKNKYKSPDEAARAVLDILAPLSAKYGLELGGNIKEIEGLPSRLTGRVLKRRYRYTMPVIGESTHVGAGIDTNYRGYHTHTGGKFVFSNRFYNALNNPNVGDAEWVKNSGQPLYVGVVGPDGRVQVGVCEAGKCPTTGEKGTEPTRTIP